MADSTFVAIAAFLVAAGYVGGSKRWAPAAPIALWVAGLGIAAALGAFRPTNEDNSLGLFVFAAVPALVWLGCAESGISLRRVHERFKRSRSHVHPDASQQHSRAGARRSSG